MYMSIKAFGQTFCSLTVLVAGCGYLIDMFDFFLFNMVRVKSLTDLGLSGDALTDAGIMIVNCQLVGLMIGGISGLVVLIGRVFIKESELFTGMSGLKIAKGGLMHMLKAPGMFLRFVACITLTATCVFIPQVLWTLSPEIGKQMGIVDPIQPQIILGLGYTCVIMGDLLAAWLSETFKNRKAIIGIFMLCGIVSYMFLLYFPIQNTLQFYLINMSLGLTFGAMIVTMTLVAEQFGTNYRATIATTVPNFARGTAILMNLALVPLKAYGLITAITLIGSFVFILAILSWFALQETYGKDLNYYD